MGGLRVPLFLIGVVALLSGVLKARARTAHYYGGVGLGLIEILAGTVCVFVVISGAGNTDSIASLASLTGAVVLISTISRVFAARRIRAARVESESQRLYSQVKYGDILGGIVIPEGVELSLPPEAADESSPENDTDGDPPDTSDAVEPLPGNEPPLT